jgi:hypothetical protein
MKHSVYDLEEQNANRIQSMKEEISHLSSSIEGLIKKVQALEKVKLQQDELNEAVSAAIGEIAEELEMLDEEEALS